ncbi:unnamed protein product [Thelazia callipaeda]|uniref:C-type lectin domain-containing protein n=1 Tax=Thelazia callipaeda TaxID=103827 RepID=A0A0N5CLD5_THECL|nr:unnamed protein product [Thelazia callipaeda]
MKSLLIYLLSAYLLNGIFARKCKEGWLYSPHTKYCYILVNTRSTFNNAEFACLIKKANLVSIHSEQENRFISGTRPRYNKGRRCVKINTTTQEWFNDCCYIRPVPYICKKSPQDVPYWHAVIKIPSDSNNKSSIDGQSNLKLSDGKYSGKYFATHKEEDTRINKGNYSIERNPNLKSTAT